MNYNLEIQKILLESDKQDNPEDRIQLLKQAIKVADTHNDIDWGFDLRMDLVRTEQYTNHSRESFPAFAWILDAYDNDKDVFPIKDILNEYKWLAAVCFNNLRLSLEQIENILDDFRRRLHENGYGDREYYNIKMNQSLFKGEKDLAREYLELRDKSPVDEMTSESNDLIGTIYVEMFEGDFVSAILHMQEYQSKYDRNMIPVYSGLIYYLGGKNYDPRVEKYFEEADEEFSGLTKYPFQLYEMSLIMYYMAKYRKDRAWEYFNQFVNWEIDAEESIRFDFALSVLPLLKDGGKKELNVISSRHPYYREDNVYNLNDLYVYYKEIATDMAQQFDIRNRSTHYQELLQEEFEQLK